MDDEGAMGWILLILGLAAIITIVYIAILVASAIVAAGAAGGVLWGGGTAIANYGLSFKENMIDSNRATV